MNRFRREIAFACVFVLALAVGPLAVVCVNCCPQGAARTSLMALPACCGNCAPTLERPADLASLAAWKAAVEQDTVATLAPSSANRSLIQTFQPAAGAASSARSLSSPSPAPRRL